MFITKIRNADGEILNLSEATDRFVVSSIIGLNPPVAQINTTKIVGLDGARLNSASLNTRNIVINLMLRGDQEANRQELYEYFRTKGLCRFYFQNNNRNVYADGIVETVECDMFQRTEQMQVSIICPSAYFSDVDQYVVDLSNSQMAFYFPFSIDENAPIEFSTYESERVTEVINGADAETGILMLIRVLGSVSNIVVQNVGTGEGIDLTGTFLEGDELWVNTDPNDTQMTWIRNGVEASLFPTLSMNSVLLTLAPGSNFFGYMVDGHTHDNLVQIGFTFRQQYRGI